MVSSTGRHTPARAQSAGRVQDGADARGVLSPKLRVLLVVFDTVKIGPGRAALLEMIERRGSIKAAAEQFGMSYRFVWGFLRELEAAAGFPFIERQRGRGATRGARLTPAGKQLLAQYWEFSRRLEAAAAREFPAVFPNA